jgi:hypothetical protein
VTLRRLLAVALFQLAPGIAQACLFATSTPPQGWYQWAAGLFAGDVTAIENDAGKLDVITVRAVETFKGPDATHGTLTVRISTRYWTNCKVDRPVAGARVLVAVNPGGDAMLVPLSESYAERLRAHRSKQN